MRRLLLVFSVVLLVGAFAVGAPAALAGNTDWAVNGVALAPGQQVPVKFASITPVQLIVPDRGIDITCSSWKGKGTITGGEIGTGELVEPKFGHCTEQDNGALIHVKVVVKKAPFHTDLFAPANPGEKTTEWELIGICFSKGRCEPVLEIGGVVDSIGPFAGPLANMVGFPQPALPATTLTVGGSPAELVGEAVFKLPKKATLSQTELH